MTTQQWCEYLTQRCESEGVELWFEGPELFGWVGAGVGKDDDPDDVFEALCESLADVEA